MVTSADGQEYPVQVGGRTTKSIVMGVGAVALIVLFLFPLFGVTDWTRRLVEFFCYLAAAQMWNLLLGYAGLMSAGQQAYIGLGAYTVWFFADIVHINPLLCVLFAAITGAIIAFPAAALVFRLRGGYLAIGTWVIAEIFRLIFSSISQTGGGAGTTIGAAAQMAQTKGVDGWYSQVYWLALAVAVLTIAVCYLLLRSRTGLALKAIRDDDLSAESSGVNLWRTKLYTYIIAGAGCAMAGALIALYSLQVRPGSAFSINWTAYLIFITVIGGIGTIEGPFIGTVIFYALRETTSKYGTWYFIVLGLLAAVIAIWSRGGIYGWILKKTGFTLFPLQRRVGFGRSEKPPSPPASEGGGGAATV